LEYAARSEVVRSLIGSDLSGLRIKDVVVGIVELRVIEEIVRVRPDFQVHAFPDAETLGDAQVEVYESWSRQDVSSGVPERWAICRRVCE
jgi:hypothetical protein